MTVQYRSAPKHFHFSSRPSDKMETFLVLCVLFGVCAANSVYTTYLWHMQQPIYWPDKLPSNPNTYQKAYDSIQLKNTQGGHPYDNMDDIFGKDDRVNDYQHYALDAVQSCAADSPDMGAQVSFSGCLIENLNNLADNNHIYSSGWNNAYSGAINSMKTSGGDPKLDFVSFTYHHALTTLIDRNALAKEIAIHKLMYAKTWNKAPYSKGFFPAEMVFTERAIPTLVAAGLQWVIVANNHISRACKKYPYDPHGDNNSPPNKADQVNPEQSSYFRESISRGCVPNNAYPFSYRPHYAQYVDPETGNATKIIVIPAAMAMSWLDGYQCYGTSDIDKIAGNSDPTHPILVLLAHDGDNAFGGGNSYYEECVKNFVNEGKGKGYIATTVQQYLRQFPVDENDVVHVEDGGWVNPDGDFGSPQSLQWNYPLQPNKAQVGQFDIENGWSLDERNWAVLTAAENVVETAEQVSIGAKISEIQAPSANATEAELAWHFFLPGLTSGYMYYGGVEDMPVKQTVAANNAVAHGQKAIAMSNGLDQTPPTVWALQRLPWNPGACGMGELWGYKYTPMATDFHVWTFAYDVSGISSVVFNYRKDMDGINPLQDNSNEVYKSDLTQVTDWTTMKMNERVFPKGNVYNASIDLSCNSTKKDCLPTIIANEFWIKITGLKDTLIDYFVTATDTKGNVKKTDIYHVYIGAGNAACKG
ncbi:alpha-amylase-like [Halichondria panicea]|uniref:alpha-amylase-like n=1 Tax=Halichondria panicea TaxID=6063 RepID=UPI00312BC054